MSLDSFLLEVLVCPDNHEKLTVADDALVKRINKQIEGGGLRNRGGAVVDKRTDSALVRADGTYAYLVRDNIPVMLIDEAVALIELE